MANGEKIKQETRGWNDAKQITESQRSKEESHDYRYFPEPDLPPLTKDGFDVEKIKMEIPELPNDKRKRFSEQYKLSNEQMNVLIEDKEMSDYFEESISELESDEEKNPPWSGKPAGGSLDKVKLLLNYLTSDLRGLLINQKKNFEQSKITPENFADLIDMIFKKEITSRVAKDLLIKMLETGLDPREVVKNEGLGQVSDESELILVVKKIIDENPTAVADYKKGKTNALQFLVGKAMAALRGKGNPDILKKLFTEVLTK